MLMARTVIYWHDIGESKALGRVREVGAGCCSRESRVQSGYNHDP